MGRPTKRTPETEAVLVAALRAGNTRTDAVAVAGLSLDTLSVWGKDDPEFLGRIEKAEAEHRLSMLAKVVSAASESWQAAAWFLERRDSEHYGRRDRVDMTLDFRKEAERIAAANGLDPDEVMAEAERVLAGAK